jgi:6-phosphogluconate dehydrogenase (decarboxylating)
MQLGMMESGRMGGNMVRRLLRNHRSCVIYDRSLPAGGGSRIRRGQEGAPVRLPSW